MSIDQFMLFVIGAVDRLEEAPALERYWLVNPWMGFGCLLLLGIAFFIAGGRSNAPKQQMMGLLFVPVGLVVVISSMMIETGREQMMRETKVLVESAVAGMNTAGKGDSSAGEVSSSLGVFKGMLLPKVRFSVKGVGLDMTREQMMKMIETNVETYHVSDVSFSDMQAEISSSGLRGKTQTEIRSSVSYRGFERGARTTFRFSWERETKDEPWRVREIDFLEVNGGQPPEDVWKD